MASIEGVESSCTLLAPGEEGDYCRYYKESNGAHDNGVDSVAWD
jgi:hypothetical protein